MTTFSTHIEKYYPYAWVILFFISYLVFYPENWMITDAYNYVNRGIAFSMGEANMTLVDFLSGEEIKLIPAPYNTGTSFFLCLAIGCLGKPAVFLVPLFQVIFSVYFLSRALQRCGYSQLAISLLGFSMSLMFFSRSLMSCMPSFLVISAGCYLFFRKKMDWKVGFALGAIFSFSLWFRESNVFLLAPFVIHSVYYNRSLLVPVGVGVLLGLSPKILFDKWVYDSYWFSSASSGFSVPSLIDHLPEYTIILTLLLPVSWVFIAMYSGKGDKSIKVASGAFVILYLFYRYSAVDFSGLLKGSFLTSRFMIPLLPIVVISAGQWISKNDRFATAFRVLAVMSLLVIPASQYAFHKLYQSHEMAAKELTAFVGDGPVVADFSGYTNIVRYYNPLTAQVENIGSIQYVSSMEVEQEAYLILSRSQASAEKQMRADSIASLVDKLHWKLAQRIEIDSGENWLEVYTIDK